MGKKSPSVPPPPDPTKMVQAQGQANKDAIAESAKVNAVDLYGPNGSTTYGLKPDGTPHSQYTNLTPEGQWLYDAQQAIGGQLMQQAYNRTSQIPTGAFSLSGMPHAPQGYNTSSYEMFRPVSLPQGADAMSFRQPMNDPSNFFSGGQFGGQAPQGQPGAATAAANPGGGGKGAGQQPPAPQGFATSASAPSVTSGAPASSPPAGAPSATAAPSPSPAAPTPAPSASPPKYESMLEAHMRGSWSGRPTAQTPSATAAPATPAWVDGRIGPQGPNPNAPTPQMPQMPGGGQGPTQVPGMPPQQPGMPPPGGGQQPGGQSGNYYPGQPGGDMNVVPYDPRSYGNINQYVNQTQDAVYDQQMRNLQPAINQQYDRQYQKLKDMGLPVGGEAWNSAIGELNRNVGNQYQQAANQAIAAGGEEANRRLGMEQGLRGTAWTEALSTHQQQNSDVQQRLQIEQNLRNQAIQEQLMERNQGFNEASAFLQGTPAMGMPQAPQMQQYTMQAPDVIGAHLGGYNAAMQGYNARNAASGSAWQGAANLAGAGAQIAMKCSRAFKCDDGEPERILEAVKKLPIRTWRYQPHIDPRQELHIGPYAEDWKRELGLGNGQEINVIDLCGVLLKSVQELSDEIAALKAEKVTLAKEPIMPRPPQKPKAKKAKRGVK